MNSRWTGFWWVLYGCWSWGFIIQASTSTTIKHPSKTCSSGINPLLHTSNRVFSSLDTCGKCGWSFFFYILGAAAHEGLLTILAAAPHEGLLILFCWYWELPLTRGYWLYIGSCPSRGATDSTLGTLFLVAMATYWLPRKRIFCAFFLWPSPTSLPGFII